MASPIVWFILVLPPDDRLTRCVIAVSNALVSLVQREKSNRYKRMLNKTTLDNNNLKGK